MKILISIILVIILMLNLYTIITYDYSNHISGLTYNIFWGLLSGIILLVIVIKSKKKEKNASNQEN